MSRHSRFLSIVACLLVTLALAQQTLALSEVQAPADPREVIKVFQIRYINIEQLKQILSVFPAKIDAPQGPIHALTVKGSPEAVDAVEETIKKLDVAPPRVEERAAELTIFVLSPIDQFNGALPASLLPVITQLNRVFAYKGFRLIDTIIVNGIARADRVAGSGSQSSSGTFQLGSSQPAGAYTFTAAFQLRRSDKNEPYLFLPQMNFTVRAPRVTEPKSRDDFYDVGIRTDLELRPGQQNVVGKTSVGTVPLILVMSARFLD